MTFSRSLRQSPVVLNKDDPAVSVLAQCALMRPIIREADLTTRKAEVRRLMGFCAELLLFWENDS